MLQVNRVENLSEHTHIKPHTALRSSSSGTLKDRSAPVTVVTASPTGSFLPFHSSSDVANRAERMNEEQKATPPADLNA